VSSFTNETWYHEGADVRAYDDIDKENLLAMLELRPGFAIGTLLRDGR
jgi:hypothetical protein